MRLLYIVNTNQNYTFMLIADKVINCNSRGMNLGDPELCSNDKRRIHCIEFYVVMKRSTCNIFLIIIVVLSPKGCANIYSIFVLDKKIKDKRNRGYFILNGFS